MFLILLILLAGSWSSSLSPYFLNVENLFDLTKLYVATGLVALGLALVIIIGEIDIAVPSTLALSSVVFALLWEMGIDVWLAALFGLTFAALLGLINGLLVGVLRLSSFAVTLGTLAAYKGIALVLVGAREVAGFPEAFTRIGFGYVGTSPVPVSLVVILLFGAAFALLLHGTRFGRYIYSIGASREAARFSGIPVSRVQVWLFTLSGFMAGVAGLITAGVFGSVRAYWESDTLLDALTAVVLGGVSIYGGSGSIAGVLLALFLLAVLRNGMGVAFIGAPVQAIIVGVLLLAAMSLGTVNNLVRERRAKAGRTKAVSKRREEGSKGDRELSKEVPSQELELGTKVEGGER